jgi:hypothetical protein
MIEMSPKATLIVACLVVGSTGLAMAHHSNAAYDSDHPQSVQGTVKQVNWTNPHTTFVVETDAKEGPQAGTWVFEVSSPGVLTRSGWTKHSLNPGDRATFDYLPLRDGKQGGFLRKVTMPDGKELTYSLMPDEQ